MSAAPPEIAAAERPKLAAVFRHRNYRVFIAGQIVSLLGTWMQIVAQGWLVASLTGSPAMLGLVAFASQGPVFFLALIGGTLADRFPKRKLLLVTNGLACLQAGLLAILTLTGLVEVWHIVLLAFGLGLLNAIDIPTRQAFTIEMVGRADLPAAIAVNSIIFNSARIIGPALAGLIVVALGEGWCFSLNTLTFGAVLLSLSLQRFPARALPRRNPFAEAREGIAYVAAHRRIRLSLLLLAIAAFAGAPYMSLMPLFVQDVLKSDAQHYGFMMSAIGLGGLAGALAMTRLKSRRGLVAPVALLAFGAFLVLFSQSRAFALAVALVTFTAFSLMLFAGTTNTAVQLATDERMRGRVMAFYTMCFMGMMPWGALAGGALAKLIGVPATLTSGGAICLIAGLAAFMNARNGPADRPAPAEALPLTPDEPQ